MTEYPKIESIFVRDEKTHKLNPGQWRLQEFDYLKDCPWVCTEKVDGCLHASTRINTDLGPLSIGRIVKGEMPVRVRSYNLNTGFVDYMPILAYHREPAKGFIAVRVRSRMKGNRPKVIVCTENHPFWTGGAWIPACDLREGNEVAHWVPAVSREVGEAYPESLPIVEHGAIVPTQVVSVGRDLPIRGSAGSRAEQFDIEVGGNHNYFAQDVLVHNTNIRVMWDGERVTFGGRTDKAQLYVPLLNRLTEMFPAEKMVSAFGPPAEDGPTSICLYGEGYGKGIQKGGVYRDTPDFILFDIRVGPWWLKREDVRSLASELGIEQVPVRNVGPLPEAVDLVREGLISCWGNFPAEGLVCRPAVDLLMRNGQRVITKVKGCDF